MRLDCPATTDVSSAEDHCHVTGDTALLPSGHIAVPVTKAACNVLVGRVKSGLAMKRVGRPLKLSGSPSSISGEISSRDPLQARHGLSKFSYAGAKSLILHPDFGAAAVASQVRMVAKISDGLELSCAAVGTNDFYGDFIQCVFRHM